MIELIFMYIWSAVSTDKNVLKNSLLITPLTWLCTCNDKSRMLKG